MPSTPSFIEEMTQPARSQPLTVRSSFTPSLAASSAARCAVRSSSSQQRQRLQLYKAAPLSLKHAQLSAPEAHGSASARTHSTSAPNPLCPSPHQKIFPLIGW
jgi:hypothetical protein